MPVPCRRRLRGDESAFGGCIARRGEFLLYSLPYPLLTHLATLQQLPKPFDVTILLVPPLHLNLPSF